MDNNNQNNFQQAEQVQHVQQAPPQYQETQQVNELPFIPKKQNDDKVKGTHAKVIIILLACILAVNIAALVVQLVPRNEFSEGARIFSGGNPPVIQQYDDNGNGEGRSNRNG